MTETETQYYETNDEGERVLSYDDDQFVKVQNDGTQLTVNVVSRVESSEAYTYGESEGFYKFSPDDTPVLVEELDALFRVLANTFDTEPVQRNPGDGYEIVVSRKTVKGDEEQGTTPSRNHAHFFISPDTNFDALAVLDEILENLVSK